MATVQGRVVERFTKRPVAGATVNVGGNITYTDGNGNFTVETSQGRQDLQITANGYHPWMRSMNFKRARNNVALIGMDSDIRAQ